MRVQAAVIVLVFSILDRKSLAEVESTFAPLIRQNAPKTAILLVGQDNDARARGTEETSIQDAQDAAGRIGAKCYIECSSATGDWVNTVFIPI
jgi:GTPase SAR1 family protein